MKKKFYAFIREFVFKAWLFSIKPSKRDTKHYLSVCAIFKNEARDLKEWLEYHLMLGVEHFYLYNNNSSDNYMEVLRPYIEKGIVTFTDWPEIGAQVRAYRNCYNNHKNDTFWLAYIDIDEFLCPLYVDSMAIWLKRFEKFPTIFINEKRFGTSGLQTRDENSFVIESFYNCEPDLLNIGKSIINTSYGIIPEIHYSKFYIQLFGLKIKCNFFINEKMKIIGAFNHNQRVKISSPTVQSNHYTLKSFDELKQKIDRGRASVDVEKYTYCKRDYDGFCKKDLLCTSEDFAIMRFLPELKKKCGR